MEGSEFSAQKRERGGMGQPGQRDFLSLSWATRALTTFLIKAMGRGLSRGKWMVPLEVEKFFSSCLKDSITDAVGNRLRWSEKAAYQTSTPLAVLKAGMR